MCSKFENRLFSAQVRIFITTGAVPPAREEQLSQSNGNNYNHSSVIIVYAKKRAVFDLFSRII